MHDTDLAAPTDKQKLGEGIAGDKYTFSLVLGEPNFVTACSTTTYDVAGTLIIGNVQQPDGSVVVSAGGAFINVPNSGGSWDIRAGDFLQVNVDMNSTVILDVTFVPNSGSKAS